MRRLVTIIVAIILLGTAVYKSAKASAPEWKYLPSSGDYPTIVLSAPTNATYAYLYGTPIYDIGLDLIHRAVFHLSPHQDSPYLNFWNFVYPVGTEARIIGRDSTNNFILVVVDTGQVGWIPINQTNLQAWLLDGVQEFYMDNAPDYSGSISLLDDQQ